MAQVVRTVPYARAPKGTKYYLEAKDISFKTLVGYSYENVSMAIAPGEVCAIRGHNGTGKTSLLLTLAGHMVQNTGTLRVGEYILPKQRHKVQQLSGISVIQGLNDMPRSLKVISAVSAEFELYGRRVNKESVLRYLASWGLDKDADMPIKMLSYKDRARLGIALACVKRPPLLVVDDIEFQLTMGQSKELMNVLKNLAETRGMAIVVAVVERELAAMADSVVYLEKEGR